MDLRSILSTSDSGGPTKHAPPPPAASPSTPGHSAPPYGFRDYSHGPQASPIRPGSGPGPGPPGPMPHQQPQQPPHEYPPHPHPHQPPQHSPPTAAYPPQSPYKTPQAAYPPRHHPPQPPPPIQPVYNDARSPGGPAMPMASPYRQTPTSAVPGGPAGGYPFPPTPLPPQQQQAPPELASPVQRHPHTPSANPYGSRDVYPQQAGPPPPGSYMQGPPIQQQSPMQQGSPVIPPGAAPHGYLHQRTQSVQSTPTPTSAQSQQHPYGPPTYAHGSPVAASHPLPVDYARQHSQPPTTPLGPPVRQTSGSFAQPPSPHQQRMSGPLLHQQAHGSPAAHHPTVLPRTSTSSYDPQAVESQRRSQSRSERDRSISVSPKTRVPSLPPSASIRRGSTVMEQEPPRPSFQSNSASMEPERAATPAKRKLEDRDLPLEEMERREPRPPPGEVNGGYAHPQQQQPPPSARASTSPVMQRRRRIRYKEPPVWARDYETNTKLGRSENYVFQEHRPPSINGNHDASIKSERASRNTSPETARQASLAVAPPAMAAAGPTPVSAPPPPPPPPEVGAADMLGPWEPSLFGVRPYEEISRRVADWLYIMVVSNPSMGEIQSRGIQFEVEAKLGTVIDRDTNGRVDGLMDSECLLKDTQKTAFQSSMNEAQHKVLNEFLNSLVVETNPRNPQGSGTRVEVHYKRRREVDRYFELPPALQDRLPGYVRSLIPARHAVKARVTYDQKTGGVLAKIVKARVADLELYMPHCALDCRISVNLEMDWEGPAQELEALGPPPGKNLPDRKKDRISYTQGPYQIDLTQVTQTFPGPGEGRTEKEHELEIEVQADILIDQGRRAASGEPNRYQELVEGLIDNVRLMARRAKS